MGPHHMITRDIQLTMLDWQRIDSEVPKAIILQKKEYLQAPSSLIDTVLLNDRLVVLYADFAQSLEVVWQSIKAEPVLEIGQQLKQKVSIFGLPQTLGQNRDKAVHMAVLKKR
jgi:hypothetical protein